MNKNKIILAIIGGIVVVLLLWLAATLNSSTKDKNTPKSSGTPFSLWMVGNEKTDLSGWISYFKEMNPQYKTTTINVEIFASYEEYQYALTSAIIKEQTPDIFVLNNNEKTSIFEDQVLAIDPGLISPTDFRKKYKGVFGDDLIVFYTNEEEQKEIEFLKGVPVGYETLGVFYDRRYAVASDLENISSLNNAIIKIKKKTPSINPIALGNGSTVSFAADIITQFFMLEASASGLKDLAGNVARQALTGYELFGDITGSNRYNTQFKELDSLGKDDVYSFTRGNTRMIVGYPRMLYKIAENGYKQKNLLQAAPFPHYFSGDGKTLLNYDYFVLNKESSNTELAYKLLQSLTTDGGADEFLDDNEYYLPALLSLESDYLEEKVDDDFTIVLGDFYNPDYELGSFDKGIKSLYDSEIISVLDNSTNYLNVFEDFRRKLSCKTVKVNSLSNLSSVCK